MVAPAVLCEDCCSDSVSGLKFKSFRPQALVAEGSKYCFGILPVI